MIAAMRTTSGCIALATLLGSTAGGCNRKEHVLVAVRHTDAAGLAADAGGMVLGPTMPDDFPADIPLYPDAGFTIGGRSTAAGKPTWSVTVETSDSKEQVMSEYRRALSAFQSLSNLDLGDSALSVWRNDSYDLILMIGRGTDGKTTVTIDAASR
jgi:hypothetical protein